VVQSDALNRSRHQTTKPYFTHEGKYAGLFRDALVLLSLSLCLRQPADTMRRLLDCCERGDPLIEALAETAGAAVATSPPAFPQFFNELYSALHAQPAEQSKLIAAYLSTWLERMSGFGFVVAHEQIGYWCIEAAGIVTALGIDDTAFADDAHYPKDLVAFTRRH
jgi:hypothetical protein